MIINGWYCCPFCRKKLFPVVQDTKAVNLRIKCKACKNEVTVNINN